MNSLGFFVFADPGMYPIMPGFAFPLQGTHHDEWALDTESEVIRHAADGRNWLLLPKARNHGRPVSIFFSIPIVVVDGQDLGPIFPGGRSGLLADLQVVLRPAHWAPRRAADGAKP
jgi:hypothetical protein